MQPDATPPPPTAPDHGLTCDGLQVDVHGRTVLRGITLRVPVGTTVGLVGETGAGKSMTCRAVTGLLGRVGARAVGGRLDFGEIDLLTASARDWSRLRGRRIALVPQASGASLDPVMRVGAQVEETVKLLDAGAEPRKRAVELFEAVDMPNITTTMRMYPHELSGGMKQRVMLALALAGRPELLVADEATTALDVTTEARILALIRRLQTEAGMALLFVTHDLSVVATMAETVVAAYGGLTVESGPADVVLNAPRHPYTRALIGARPEGTEPGVRLPTIPGLPPEPGASFAGCIFAERCPHVAPQCRVKQPELSEIVPGHHVACVRSRELYV